MQMLAAVSRLRRFLQEGNPFARLGALLLLALGWLLGLEGVPLAVMVVTAGLPIGANVYLFSQRYGVAEELITASVAVTTVMGLITLPLAMLLVRGVV